MPQWLTLLGAGGPGGEAPPFSPLDLSPLLWLRADLGINSLSGIGADNDPVATWYDQSGNGSNASQATSGSRPLLKTSVVNGLPVVRYDGSDDCLVTTLTTPAQHTVLIAYANRSGTHGGFIGEADLDSPSLLQRNAASWFDVQRTQIDMTRELNSYNIYAHRFDYTAGAYGVRINGVVVGSSSDTGGQRSTRAWGIGVSYGYCLAGDIAEALLYPTILSDPDVAACEQYLAGKYGFDLG